MTVGELLISASASSRGGEALSVRRLGTIGIAGAAYFVVTVVVLHFIQTDPDLIEITIRTRVACHVLAVLLPTRRGNRRRTTGFRRRHHVVARGDWMVDARSR